MLFTYSPRALSGNWLNPTITEMLLTGMQTIRAGYGAPSWPGVIPGIYRPALKRRSGIRTRFEDYWREFSNLDESDQKDLIETLERQASLPSVLYDDSSCRRIDSFPEGIRKVTVELFRFIFSEQLSTLIEGGVSLRDRHYRIIYEEFPSRICPFCGLGYFRAPGAPRNALDHYMPISKYPFVGADFQNLPPMCSECNSDYKKDLDVLFDDNGLRRRCVDPYRGPVFRVSLSGSMPFAGPVKNGICLPKWKIQFVGGPSEEAENWDRIFKIRERYERDVLNAEFRSWLQHFAFWYAGGRHGRNFGDEIADSIPEYLETVIQNGLADRAFLKAEVFGLIRDECSHPQRGGDMKAFLKSLVQYA